MCSENATGLITRGTSPQCNFFEMRLSVGGNKQKNAVWYGKKVEPCLVTGCSLATSGNQLSEQVARMSRIEWLKSTEYAGYLTSLFFAAGTSLFTASTMSVSIILIYFLVVSSDSCPMIFAIVTMFSFLRSKAVAKLCLSI